MPSPWARSLLAPTTTQPVECAGCAICVPAIAEAEAKVDEAYWAEEVQRMAEQDAAEAEADAAFWDAQR